MGLKYFAYFNSTAWAGVTSVRYKIEIYDTAFSGTATEVTCGGNPFSEKELNNDETPYGIKACRFEIEIVSDTVTVDDFYTLEGMSHRVKLFEAPLVGDMNLIRDGYLLSEDVQEVYEDGVKVIQLSGTDGIELLKTIPFEFSADKPYSGIMTALLLLDRCITPIGLGLNVNTSFNYWQDGQSKADAFEPLAFFNVHAPLFEGKMCYDALDMLCKTLKCAFYEEDGEWWFIHTINPDGMTQVYRKWDSTFNYLSAHTFDVAKAVEFEGDIAPFNGNKLKKRSYKSVTTEIDLQGYVNKLRNADFQSGFDEWITDTVPSYNFYPVDSYSFGGGGTTKDPYYIQIDGWDTRENFDLVPRVVYQEVIELYNSAVSVDSVYKTLEKGISISGAVKGKGVKEVNFFARAIITFDNYDYPVAFVLNENSEWDSADAVDNLTWPILSLIYENGETKDEYTTFKITSKSIGSAAFPKGFYNRIFNNKLIKLKIENMTSCNIEFVISEGIERTTITDAPEWVRWADLRLEVIDKSRSVGLKKNRYISEQSTNAPNVLKVESYFADHYDPEQFITTLQSDGVTPTVLWEDLNGNNQGELQTSLTRELLSLYYKPTSLYDGDIFLRVKKYDRITLLNYANELININWNWNFKDSIGEGMRYLMTFSNYGTFTNSKLGVYNDDKEIPYDNEFPTGVYEFDEVPVLNGDLISKILNRITENAIVQDKLSFSKISNESGINWYDSITGDESDYMRLTDEGFVFKSESSPYTAILDFSDLTDDTVLKLPNSGDILSSETGWQLNGNALTVKKTIGSTTAYDVGIIRNSVEVLTATANGVVLPVLSNESTDVDKFLVSNAGLVKYRTGTQILSDIGGFASPTGLTTNYVTKWDGTALANSQIFDNGTNVGIGTASPSGKLDVYNATNGSATLALTSSVGAVNQYIDVNIARGGGAYNYMRYAFDGSEVFSWGANLSSYAGGMTLNASTSLGHIRLLVDSSEIVRIANNGNVGIGTTTPSYKLDVTGTLHSTGNAIFDSNVGIGTASPSVKLEVLSTSNTVGIFESTSSFSFIALKNSSGNLLYFGNNSSGDLLIQTPTSGYSTKMAILNGGNVGIGTTSPSAKLHVEGDIHLGYADRFIGIYYASTYYNGFALSGGNRSTGVVSRSGDGTDYIWFGTNDASERARFSNNGNFGIGTTTPSYKLDVNGTSRTTNLLITNGAAVGKAWQCTNADGTGAWVTPLASERYIGEWDASSGSAPSGSPTSGDYWRVNNGGTYSSITYVAGDDIYWTGSAWAKRSNYLSLPIATGSILGGIKIGSGLAIDGSGVVTVSTLNQNTTGSAATLTTARTIAASGDATWSVSFNGSADVTAALTLATITDSGTGTFLKLTRNGKGLVTGTVAVAQSDITGLLGANSITNTMINSLAWSKLTSVPTTISGYGITDAYTKTESDAKYVDITTSDQEVTARKYFYAGIKFRDVLSTLTTISRGSYSKTGGSTQSLSLSTVNIGLSASGFTAISNGNNIKGLFADSGLLLGDSLDYETYSSERLQVDGNIRYNALLKPNNVAGTSGQFLKTSGTQDLWATITTSDISNLSSYTGFDARYYTETESDNKYFLKANITTTNGYIPQVVISGGLAYLQTSFISCITGVSDGSGNIISNIATDTIGRVNISSDSNDAAYFGKDTGKSDKSTSSNNAAFGHYALATSETTLKNTSVGYNGLRYLTSGNNNVAIGYAAGLKSGTLDHGSYPNLAISDNSIFIGYQTSPLSGSQTNQMVIGYDLKGQGSNTVSIGNSSVTANYFNGSLKYGTLLKPNNTAGTNLQVLSTSGTQDSWVTLTTSYISDIATNYQAKLSGTGFIKISGTTISYDNSTYLTTSSAASTYQPLLPSGTSGQFLVKDSGGSLNFMDLKIRPIGLSLERIGVGNTDNYLGEQPHFLFKDKRYIQIARITDTTKQLNIGLTKKSNNGFIEQVGGNLSIRATDGIYLTDFASPNRPLSMLTIDSLGKVSVSSIAGGGGSQSNLTTTHVGFGVNNALGSSSNFTFLSNRYLHFTDSSSNFNVGVNGLEGFVESVNGNLNLQARGAYGVVVDDGFFKVADLAGTGTRMVVASSTGVLSTQTIPSGSSQDIDDVLGVGNTAVEKTLILNNTTTDYINFNNASGVAKGSISLDTQLFLASSSGVGLSISSGDDLELIGTNVDIGFSNTTGLINLQGSGFNFNPDAQNGGGGASGNQWGSGFNQTAPVAGDRVIFLFDGTRWVMSHVHTYSGAGGKTYLTID